MDSNINILIPYSRAYVTRTYKVSEQDAKHVIEQNLILKLISRLSEGLDVKKITVLSNDLKHLESTQSKKIFFRQRPSATEYISDRSDLENLGRMEFPGQNFLMVNPLFPMITLKTVREINQLVSNKSTNVFLGAQGKCRSCEQEMINLPGNDMMWDFGAISGVCGKSSIHQWEPFSEYTTMEVMNVRKAEDVQQILQILSLGLI